jgi:pyruvate formate lyase activating enzyme
MQMPANQLNASAEQTKPTLAVSGLVPLTANDFPGCLAAVIFCQGCPWSCRYCHNPHLQPRCRGSYDWQELINFFRRRIGLLDAIVFSGGEPVIQLEALFSAATELKAMGFKIGLHTGGCYPAGIKQLLPLLDWVGLDIKALSEDYAVVTGVRHSGIPAYQSLKLLLDADIDLEVRTTINAALITESQLLKLAQLLSGMGVKNYALQYFRPIGCNDLELNNVARLQLSKQTLQAMHDMFITFVCRS